MIEGVKMYKVSVIIPMYKVEEYLRECLDSVVNQTLKDIEVICVDDGSPDRSAEIAAEYVEKYQNFKLIRKENGGLSDARNAGLDVATGEYIYFLDSDDYIASSMLEILYQKANENALDIIYFNANLVFQDAQIREKNKNYIDYYTRRNDYSGLCSGQNMFAKMQKDKKFLPSACLQIFRREFIEHNGFRFYTGILHEDNLFSFCCAMSAEKTDYVPDAFYFRCMHDDSIMTSQKSMRNVEGYIVSYYEALAFLRNVKIEDSVAPVVNEFLYYSLYRNACNIWKGLSPEEKKKPLVHGGIGAEHLLFVGRKAIEAENHRNRLKYVHGKFRECVSEHGYKYTVRLAMWKCGNLCARFMSTHSSGVVKRFFLCVRDQGYRFAARKVWKACKRKLLQIPKLPKMPVVKLRQKIGGKTPLVSFILPVYNVEEFLPQCLDSLIQQTMPHIEIICVDDGSTDRSLEILHQYADKDSRIRVFTQKNQFAGAARNLGLSKATGEYVVFLDSDDFFAKELAQKAYFAAKLNRADVVLFGAKHFNDQTREYREAKWLFNSCFVPAKVPFSYKDCPDHLYQITTPCPWTKMFRREFVLNTGLQFQTLRNSNDVFFSYSALAMAERIATVDMPLVYYRVGMANNLQATKGKDPLCFYKAYTALHDKLAEIGVLDELRRSYVNVTLSGCLHNLRTQKDTAVRQLVYDALKNEVFDTLELVGYEPSFYNDKASYREMRKIVDRAYDYDYFSALSKPFYEQALKKWYREKTGGDLNLKYPVTYNDKINWIKLNEQDPRKTQYADKYAVREYVEKKIGQRYLIPLINVWDDPADINFELLPEKFVLKATHGSGWNIIVPDKATLNIPDAVKRMKWWMGRKLSFCNGLELHYDGIKPRIIAEQYVENSDGELNDYKVWCFGGKAHFIQYLAERHHGLKMAFYDLDWNKLPFISNHEQLEGDVEKPTNLDELVAISEQLAEGFNHVRVDFYRLNSGEWKFGELTFTPSGGRCQWNPPEYDKIVGNLFELNN